MKKLMQESAQEETLKLSAKLKAIHSGEADIQMGIKQGTVWMLVSGCTVSLIDIIQDIDKRAAALEAIADAKILLREAQLAMNATGKLAASRRFLPQTNHETDFAFYRACIIASAFACSAIKSRDQILCECLELDMSTYSMMAAEAPNLASLLPGDSFDDVILFMMKIEEFLHAYDGIPFIRTYATNVVAISEEALDGLDGFAAEYPKEIPFFAIRLSVYNDFIENMLIEKFEGFDSCNTVCIQMRRKLFSAARLISESEDDALMILPWSIASILYGKSESALISDWKSNFDRGDIDSMHFLQETAKAKETLEPGLEMRQLVVEVANPDGYCSIELPEKWRLSEIEKLPVLASRSEAFLSCIPSHVLYEMVGKIDMSGFRADSVSDVTWAQINGPRILILEDALREKGIVPGSLVVLFSLCGEYQFWNASILDKTACDFDLSTIF